MEILEPILTYNMDPLEAKAYKIALLWQKLCQKEFPGERHAKLAKKGDPRKSLLFKYTYKLTRETFGLIEDAEYSSYLMAQLHVLKNIKSGDIHALIGPQCIVGEKAWKRWMLWKNKYNRNLSRSPTYEEAKIKNNKFFISSELEKTKNFFLKTYNSVPNVEQIKRALREGLITKWACLGKISPYYLILSSDVKYALGNMSIDDFLKFDLSLYYDSIDEEVNNIFSEIFNTNAS